MAKAQTYQWDARDYESHSSAQQQWARELIARLDLQGHERVLDIGCGDGKVTAEIASCLPDGSVVGVDNSEAMVSYAEAKYPRSQFPNLQFLQADARSLPFEDEFDRVFSNAALHWVVDHQPVLLGIRRSLRSSGKILLQMGGKGNGAEYFQAVEAVMQVGEWRDYFTDYRHPHIFYAPENYYPWLEAANLQPIRVELIPKDMMHNSPAGLAGWIRTTGLPYTQKVPEEQRDRFIDAIVTTYLEEHPVDRNGATHVQMVRLEVEAVAIVP